MSKSRTRHTRRHRRQFKQVLRHGDVAKPKHKLISGRTGHAHAKKLQAAMVGAALMVKRLEHGMSYGR